MKILVVGGGGREHAIIKKLKENPAVTEIFALPGNGGISADATCVPIGATDLDGIVQFVKEHPVDYAVVTPDDPLVLGCVDRLNEIGVPCTTFPLPGMRPSLIYRQRWTTSRRSRFPWWSRPTAWPWGRASSSARPGRRL